MTFAYMTNVGTVFHQIQQGETPYGLARQEKMFLGMKKDMFPMKTFLSTAGKEHALGDF